MSRANRLNKNKPKSVRQHQPREEYQLLQDYRAKFSKGKGDGKGKVKGMGPAMPAELGPCAPDT